MPTEAMSFKEYANTPVFSRLADIREFTLAVDIPPVTLVGDELASTLVVASVYDQLRDVVKAARFFYEDQLETIKGPDYIGVRYADDRYDFSVILTDKSIRLARSGSRLANFHDWYTALMPSAQGILSNATSVISSMAKGRQINPLRGGYTFHFVLYDITSETTGAKVKNSEIMQKLLKGLPDEKGRIVDAPVGLATMGRMDVSVTRWTGDQGKRRLLRFTVEAPANLGWSSLWFTLAYRGESYTSPDDGTREAFDSDKFLSEYPNAYVTFLRDSAINGFIEWLMHGYHFRTTAGDLR